MPNPELQVQIGATIKNLERELAKANKRLDKFGDNTEKQGKRVKKTSNLISNSIKGFVAAFGAVEALRFGARLIGELTNLAKQMEGENRRAAIVFGDSLAYVTSEAEKNAIALGLTRHEYIAAAAATQDLLIPLGFQRKEASRLSTELTSLSGVLSNWVGGQKNAREVSEILTKTILGETEQIKTLGIKIDQTSKSFNARIRQLQITKGLTLEQAKALEILTQITEKSADAQDEFANATKSLAQQEAIANAAFREQKELLATDLIPLYTSWLKIKTSLAQQVGDFSVVLSQEVGWWNKLARAMALAQPYTAQANAFLAELERQERRRLAVGEQVLKILKDTTDATAAQNLVNNLNIDQLQAIVDKQNALIESNETLIKQKEILSRPQATGVVGTEQETTLSPIETGTDGIIENLRASRFAMSEELIKMKTLLFEFNEQANNLIVGSIAETFSQLGNAIGEAIATGANVFEAVGSAILQGIGNFLKDLGKLMIQYGVAALAYSIASKALLNPLTAAPAAGALIAAGTVLTVIGGAISSALKGAGGGGSYSGDTGGGGSGQFTQGSSIGSSAGSFSSSGTVVFEIAGTKLVGVLSRTLKRNQALGGSLGLTD